jgi:hypothetical protein
MALGHAGRGSTGPRWPGRSFCASYAERPGKAVTKQVTAARLRRAQRDPHPVYLRSRRNTVLLAAGDKAGKWETWYRQAIPLAEQRNEDYLKQQEEALGGRLEIIADFGDQRLAFTEPGTEAA